MTRHIPTQERSKEKYDQILVSAKALIGEKGNDLVSMREISKHSGVTLPSIYRYFPDKAAILQTIMEEYFTQIRETLIELLKECNSIKMVGDQLEKGIDIFYSSIRDEPVLAVLWAGVQASVSLRELDAEDSITNAGIITDKICSIIGEQYRDEIYVSQILLTNMTGATVRLAVTMPKSQGDRIVSEFKHVALMRLNSFEKLDTSY